MVLKKSTQTDYTDYPSPFRLQVQGSNLHAIIDQWSTNNPLQCYLSILSMAPFVSSFFHRNYLFWYRFPLNPPKHISSPDTPLFRQHISIIAWGKINSNPPPSSYSAKCITKLNSPSGCFSKIEIQWLSQNSLQNTLYNTTFSEWLYRQPRASTSATY